MITPEYSAAGAHEAIDPLLIIFANCQIFSSKPGLVFKFWDDEIRENFLGLCDLFKCKILC